MQWWYDRIRQDVVSMHDATPPDNSQGAGARLGVVDCFCNLLLSGAIHRDQARDVRVVCREPTMAHVDFWV